ncbi:MAG: VWA domain-containing protein [Bacteroidia bacterium]|nr:VWA domain-containing protein [Bacteroidia bacterium]
MVFQQPFFLYGLFLLTIPILIHFLNFRKSKTLYFSSLRFIEEVKSTYRKRNRLTDLLLLLLRLLVMACLVFAFAQPVIPSKKAGISAPAAIVGLFLDNSQSMELSEQGESLLVKAKTKAKEFLREFPPDSRFLLLYNGSSTNLPGITDKELTLKLIDGIQPSADQLSMDDILLFFNQGITNKAAKLTSIILISDFQESLFTKPLASVTTTTSIFPIQVKPAASANISIDTCWLDNPMTLSGQNNLLSARINNRSDQDYVDFPVRLVINDTLRNETTIKLPARTVTEVALSFHPNSTGWQTGSVQISDFPVVFDNELLFSFRIESDIPVLLLYEKEENPFLRHVFGNDPYFKFESFAGNGFPRSDFNVYHLVILSGIRNIDSRISERVRDFMLKGGTVWFLPELSGQLDNYNEFLKSINVPVIQSIVPYRVDSRIASGQNRWLQEVVVNVDKRLRLPFFNQSLKVSSLSPNRIDLLNSVSGDLLLSQFRVGNGSFVLSGFPLDEKVTDLMFHPLFIPICYRIATISKNNSALYQVNGQNQPFTVNRSTKPGGNVIRLINAQTNYETIPVQQDGIGSETIIFPGYLPVSGQYSAISGTDTLARVAFNYSRSESNLNYLPDSTISKRLGSAGWNIPMNNNSLTAENSRELANEIAAKRVWYYFLIMALLALLAESFVMNRKK